MKLFLLVSFVFTLLGTDEEWITHYQNEQIEIQFRKSKCHDETNGIHQEKTLVKYVNKTDKKLQITYTKNALYSNGKSAPANENQYQVVLQPNETKTGNCNDRDKTLVIFSKHLDLQTAEVKKLHFENITIKIIE